MPLPKPRADEAQDDFLGRCMSDLKGEFPDNDQRLAVCTQQWRDKMKKGDPGPGDVHVPSTRKTCPICEHPKICGKTGKCIGKRLTLRGRVEKVDEDQRLVFGWASIVRQDGHPVVDLQDEVIPEMELEKALYNFVLHKRDAGEMHRTTGRGELVEAVAFTEEKQVAMQKSLRDQGIEATVDLGCSAAWVGFRLDPELFTKVKSGEYREFSIGGTARAEEQA